MEECIICFDETPHFVFFPCAHKVCVSCYKRLARCPVCNYPHESERLEIRVVPDIQVERRMPRKVSTSSIACGIFVMTFSVYVIYQTLSSSVL